MGVKNETDEGFITSLPRQASRASRVYPGIKKEGEKGKHQGIKRGKQITTGSSH